MSNPTFFQKLWANLAPAPQPKTIAAQLRKPSGMFAKTVGNKMNASNESLYDLTINQLDIKPGFQILEIGFGNGKFFDKIFAKAPNLIISGIDFSEAMLQEARHNNEAAVKNGTLDLRLGSSEKMPFSDNTFDLIFCINVIYFWETPAVHLQEIHRVLKPNGKFYMGIRPKKILEKLPFAQHGFQLLETNEWTTILQENGFAFRAAPTQTEPNIQISGEIFEMQGMCMIAEKI
jgi:SAM-dependent methyltransferase